STKPFKTKPAAPAKYLAASYLRASSITFDVREANTTPISGETALLLSPPASARRLNRNDVTGLYPSRELGRETFFASVSSDNDCFPEAPRPSAIKAVRWEFAPFRKNSNLGFREKSQFADNAIAAAILAGAAGTVTQRVSFDSNRISMFQRFDRRVHRIRHMR